MRANLHGGTGWLIAILSWSLPAFAQEPVAPREELEPLHYGPFDVRYSLRGAAMYDDNIFISPDKEDDLILSLTPGVLVGLGDYVTKEANLLSIEYTPSFIWFTDNSDQSSVDHELWANGQWKPGGPLTLGLRQGFQDISGAVVDVGDRVDRRIFTTDILARYELSPKTDLELEGRQTITDYDRFLDYNEWFIRGWADYKITPLVKLGAGLSAGWVDVSESVNQTYQQALVRASYAVSELIDLRASAGGERRDFQGPEDSRMDAIFSLGGTYRPRLSTTINIDGYRRPHTSVVLLNRNYISTGISAGVRQTFLQRYAVYVNGGYENADYVRTHPDADESREDDYIFGRVGADWQALDRLTLGVFYQYRKNSSSDDRFDFNNHQVALNFHLQF